MRPLFATLLHADRLLLSIPHPLSIYLFIHLSIMYLSISIYLSIYPHVSIYLSIDLSIYLHVSIYLSTCIYLSQTIMYLSIYQHVSINMYLSIYLHVSIYLPIYLFIYILFIFVYMYYLTQTTGVQLPQRRYLTSLFISRCPPGEPEKTLSHTINLTFSR